MAGFIIRCKARGAHLAVITNQEMGFSSNLEGFGKLYVGASDHVKGKWVDIGEHLQ